MNDRILMEEDTLRTALNIAWNGGFLCGMGVAFFISLLIYVLSR